MQSERDVQHSDPVELEAALNELFPARVFDEVNALTVEELTERSHLAAAQTARKVKDAVAAGTWEQVYKHTPSGRVAKAYRPKK